MATSNSEKRKFAGYSDLITCKCEGDIDMHWLLHPEYSNHPRELFETFYWCTTKGKTELTERLERAEKKLRKEDQDKWIKVLIELPKIDPTDI